METQLLKLLATLDAKGTATCILLLFTITRAYTLLG